MRLLLYITFLSFIYCVASKNNVKSLTESMGQEVIEIGSPLKDLPAGLEEEPSADNADSEEDYKVSSNAIQPATKKEIKKTTTLPDTRRKFKDIDKLDGVSQDDEEARIEKELAEIYKDTSDYKADSGESTKEKDTPTTSVEETDKAIGRQRTSFKFQPDINNNADIERFRTSVDDITCDKRVTQKLSAEQELPNSASNPITDLTYVCLTTYYCYILLEIMTQF